MKRFRFAADCHFVSASLLLVLGAAFNQPVLAAKPVDSWSTCLDAAGQDRSLAESRARLVADAQEIAKSPIVRRAYRFEDVGKNRTWLDGRALPMAGTPRQQWFALAMSDFGASGTLYRELPLLACVYRWTREETVLRRILAQLEETSSWSPLQRPGWSLYFPSRDPVPADFRDGNWLATGIGVRALADTLEILPSASVPKSLVERIHRLLEKEIASVVDDWKTRRSWFIRANDPRTNQWVLPTEGLVRACLVLGKDRHPEPYELGVRNLLAALDSEGSQGEFYEGIGYANFTVESMLHAAHAMAAAGDRRAIDHPFLRRFPTWMAHHLQPGRFRINCFDSGGARTPASDGEFRRLLSLFVMLGGDPVARWCLDQQFTGSSDDWVGLLARVADRGEQRAPPLFANYPGATRVNWRSSWAENATGVWIRGGNRLDGHDHWDHGHVNFIFRGKPILIEAGTPSYDNPNLAKLYRSAVGHNVLEIPAVEMRKVPAPITVRRLDGDGGEVSVDPGAGYPALARWMRKVTWNARRVTVVDEVAMAQGKSEAAVIRWHLGMRDEVKIGGSGGRFSVLWKDAEITLESSCPIRVTTEMLPDNTVNLGPKVGVDFLHRCVDVRPVEPCKGWTLKTEVVGR